MVWQILLTINVLVIDTGLSPLNKQMLPYVDYYEQTLEDHGPAITGLILFGRDEKQPVCSIVRLTVCNVFNSMDNYLKCLEKATTNYYDVVNISLSGPDFSFREKAIMDLVSANSIVVIAAGNDKRSYKEVYPSGLKKEGDNLRIITNMKSPVSNYGPEGIDVDAVNVMVYNKYNDKIIMTGTSMSAALYTNNIIRNLCYEYNNYKQKGGMCIKQLPL